MKTTEILDADTPVNAAVFVSLDHVQRLNLIMLLGLLEANVNEMRALWQLQDRLALSDEEKTEIGFFSQWVQGNEIQGWDVTKSLPIKTYDLSDGDIVRLRKALDQFPRHRVGLTRSWLEPLLPTLLDGKESQNGRR